MDIEFWNAVVAAFGGTAGAALVITWLVRSMVTQLMKKELAEHKTRLEYSTALELDRARSEMDRRLLEYEVLFRGLHERRSEVIATLHAELLRCIRNVRKFLRPESLGQPDRRERFKDAADSLLDLRAYFDANLIVLPDNLVETLDTILTDLEAAVSGWGEWVGRSDFRAERKRKEALGDGWKKIEEEVPVVRAKLEAEFRKILTPRSLTRHRPASEAERRGADQAATSASMD